LGKNAPLLSPPNPTPNQTNACFTRLADIPAICTGGIITQNTDLQTFDNCRHITCENGDNRLEILACEKPDEINPTSFEMYRSGHNGTDIQICLGDACIQHNGFATQEFPVCTGDAEPAIPPADDQTFAASLDVAPWYPQGNSYVLVCTAQGFTPTSYDWFFGDGEKLLGYDQDNVYHTYAMGSYDAQCVAKSDTQSEIGTLHLVVGDALTCDELQICDTQWLVAAIDT